MRRVAARVRIMDRAPKAAERVTAAPIKVAAAVGAKPQAVPARRAAVAAVAAVNPAAVVAGRRAAVRSRRPVTAQQRNRVSARSRERLAFGWVAPRVLGQDFSRRGAKLAKFFDLFLCGLCVFA